MKCDEFFDDDDNSAGEDLTEGARMVWARSGNKVVRKYRCTSEKRKGRVVSSPTQCNAPIDIKKRQEMRKTRAAKSSRMARKARKTKRFNPASKRIQSLNKGVNRMGLNEKLVDHQIEATLADILGLDVTRVDKILSMLDMPLGDYTELAMILDNNGEEVDKNELSVFINSKPEYSRAFGRYLNTVNEAKTKTAKQREKEAKQKLEKLPPKGAGAAKKHIDAAPKGTNVSRMEKEKKQKEKKATRREKVKVEEKKLKHLTEAEITKFIVDLPKSQRTNLQKVMEMKLEELQEYHANKRGFKFPGAVESKMSKRELQESAFDHLQKDQIHKLVKVELSYGTDENEALVRVADFLGMKEEDVRKAYKGASGIEEEMTTVDIQQKERDLEQAARRPGADVTLDIKGKSIDGELTGLADNPQDQKSKLAVIKAKQGGETMIVDPTSISLKETRKSRK